MNLLILIQVLFELIMEQIKKYKTLPDTRLIITACMHVLQSSNSLFVSIFLLVLPLECLFHGLFHELGSTLGGTSVGYAVVIPTNYCR